MRKRANFLLIEKKNNDYIVRMTPELQDDIGTVGFVEFTTTNELKAGDAILNLEASKTVFEMEAPLAGKIVERNEAVTSEPKLLNSARTEENWIVTLTNVDEEAFNQLEDA